MRNPLDIKLLHNINYITLKDEDHDGEPERLPPLVETLQKPQLKDKMKFINQFGPFYF